MASRQVRLGPFRILQALQDGLKLFFKSTYILSRFNFILYLGSGYIFLIFALILWVVFVNYYNIFFLFLFVLCIQAVSVYMPLIVCVSSNSKYATLAGTRSVAQMISYEIIISIIIFRVSFILLYICWPSYKTYIIYIFPLVLIWILRILAEINRTPFDLVESESELVSGFNVEYSGIPFALLFLAEYRHIIFFSLYSCFFFSIWFFIGFFWAFLFCRLVFPRLRYDILIVLCWIKLLPIGFIFLWFIILLI